ncbi:MAG: MaoC domain protein dehydratase [Polaromonas sp.]|jgi:3-hydroxybutyryl-CoA dehydratase|nr:MaoC domain protein dehydratase [Polaromonas sp.]
MTNQTATAWAYVGEKFSKHHVFNEDQVRAFATEAGDTNPLHHDAAVAARSRYGRLIVSGTHTSALLLGLTAAHFSKNFSVVGMSFSVEFRKAVLASAAVRIEWEVVATSMKGDAAQQVELRGGLYDEGGQLCVQATGLVKVSAAT